MNVTLDIAIVVTTVAAAYFGLRLGIIRAGTAVSGIVGGVMLARYSNPHVTPYVGRVFSDPEMAQAISVMAVVLGALIASIVAGAMLPLLTLHPRWRTLFREVSVPEPDTRGIRVCCSFYTRRVSVSGTPTFERVAGV